MRAGTILFTGVDRAEYSETNVPEPGPGEVLIEAAYTCISPGTELRCLAGRQRGGETFPFIPGYALSGNIKAVGDGVSLPVGTPVLCAGTTQSSAPRLWGGHVSLAIQHESGVFPLPDGVGLLDACIAPLAAIARHGLRLSKPSLGEKTAVIGLGPIGQFSARMHSLFGADVQCADLSAERVEVATKAGLNAFVPEGSPAESFQRVFPDGADIVVDSTGSENVLRQSIAIARDVPWNVPGATGARYLIQASYPADICFSYQAAFMKELTFLLPRDRSREDTQEVLQLIASGRLQTTDLITEIASPKEAPALYGELRSGKGRLITAAFDWRRL